MRALEVAKANKGHVATGASGVAMAGIALEMYRLYSQASTKAAATLDVALDKAVEAGTLQQSLDTCLEVVKMCVQ